MVRVGIIGLGFMGRMHYDVWRKLDGASVVAVADADPKRAAGDLSGGWGGNIGDGGSSHLPMDTIRGTTQWRELLTMPDVDIVDICLPTPAHVETVVEALQSGKHVLCEKPLARSVADAEIIANAAAPARGFFMPAMCMRFWSEWAWLKNAVSSKTYGAVRSASFHRIGSAPAGWFRDGKLSGGALLDLHVHDTDFVYHLFGKPQSVFTRGYRGVTGELDHVVTQYVFPDVPLVYAEGSWGASEGYGFTMRFHVDFERATADFDLARNPTLRVSEGGVAKPVEHGSQDGYVGELSYFLDCVKGGRKPARVSAADALAGLKILDAERRSIETGGLISL